MAVAGEVADRVERHLRVVRRRPGRRCRRPTRRGRAGRAAKSGRSASSARPLRGEPVAVVEQPRAEAEREREPGRVETAGLAGVVGRRELAAGIGGGRVTGV